MPLVSPRVSGAGGPSGAPSGRGPSGKTYKILEQPNSSGSAPAKRGNGGGGTDKVAIAKEQTGQKGKENGSNRGATLSKGYSPKKESHLAAHRTQQEKANGKAVQMDGKTAHERPKVEYFKVPVAQPPERKASGPRTRPPSCENSADSSPLGDKDTSVPAELQQTQENEGFKWRTAAPSNADAPQDAGADVPEMLRLAASSAEAPRDEALKAKRPIRRAEPPPAPRVKHPTDILDSPELQKLLLENKRLSDAKVGASKWTVQPNLYKKDFLMISTPEEKRKWQPRKISEAEEAREDSAVGKFAKSRLYETWVTPSVRLEKPSPHLAASSVTNAAPREAELTLPQAGLLSASDALRVHRLRTEEAMDTYLIENVNASEAWKHREGLHSELRHCPPYTEQTGTDVLGDTLLAQRKTPSKNIGVLRIESIDEEGFLDPYDANASQEDPLPFPIGGNNEQTELVALRNINQAAQTMRKGLQDRFPYLDISWSRQPSFDADNVDSVFVLQPENQYADQPITDSFFESHERLRMAATRVAQCVESKDTTKREVVRMERDINVMYQQDENSTDLGSRQQSARWDIFCGLHHSQGVDWGHQEQQETKDTLYRHPEKVLAIWNQRNRTYKELEDEEDRERHMMVKQIVHEIFTQFGGNWSNRPELQSLRTEVPNPQAIIFRYLMSPNETTQLVHSLFVPLIMERFYLFDMRYAETSMMKIEEASSLSDWCLATRALSRMGRIANYVLTAILESRIPGLLRLLFRLNALEFFEYRISYMMHMLSWRGQDNYDSKLQDARQTEQIIKNLCTRGRATAKSARSSERGKTDDAEARRKKGDAQKGVSTPQSYSSPSPSPSSRSQPPSMSPQERELLLRRSKDQLYVVLNNSTSCMAMQYNIEGICKLMPFLTEYTANMEKKETICGRLLDSIVTKAFLSALAEKQVPESPQAVGLVTRFVEMLTETLYAMRAPNMMERLNMNQSPSLPNVCLWDCLVKALHPRINIFLCRSLLCFIADLMYMTCLDEAPFLLKTAQQILDALDTVVLPTVRDKKPTLATDVTWDFCWEAAVCLRDAFKKTTISTNINPNTLYPYTLVYRCGLRAGGPWPSLWQSAWEPPYHQWISSSSLLEPEPTSQPERKGSFVSTSSKMLTQSTSALRSSMKGSRPLSHSTRHSHIRFETATQHKPPSVPFSPRPPTAPAAAKVPGFQPSSADAAGVATETPAQIRDAKVISRAETKKEAQIDATPPHTLWKGFVIPCWLPGCKNVRTQGFPPAGAAAKMQYCPE
ncbi:hypothetical protein cyc_02857 [Cyclospora cayetanensis]|uniref:Uncharacterized protein n=1 Tax=Cyclospora cayetanensis TaxID=88456 RepID=A0A1D3D6G4_9EIME|nr:hypothetical protein cyc_02857 [Cyclospora cayetanensis]